MNVPGESMQSDVDDEPDWLADAEVQHHNPESLRVHVI
jgi:hypothetical protein